MQMIEDVKKNNIRLPIARVGIGHPWIQGFSTESIHYIQEVGSDQRAKRLAKDDVGIAWMPRECGSGARSRARAL